MKLINEAVLDDQFNVQIDKIQTATDKLEAVCKKFSRETPAVSSQIRAVEIAAEQLNNLFLSMKNVQYRK